MELLFSAREAGGGTFLCNGEKPLNFSGYVVGGKVPSHRVFEVADNYNTIAKVENIAAWIDRNPSTYYGSWKDGDVIHIDAVDIVHDKEEAMSLGVKRNQLAIWDIEKGEDVRLESSYGVEVTIKFLVPFGSFTPEDAELYIEGTEIATKTAFLDSLRKEYGLDYLGDYVIRNINVEGRVANDNESEEDWG
jgi:hypothetical protein